MFPAEWTPIVHKVTYTKNEMWLPIICTNTDITNLNNSSKGVEVLSSSSRFAPYSLLSVCRNCARDCTRTSSCLLLAWTCSMEDEIIPNVEKAGARKGTGVKLKHCRTISPDSDDPIMLLSISFRGYVPPLTLETELTRPHDHPEAFDLQYSHSNWLQLWPWCLWDRLTAS